MPTLQDVGMQESLLYEPTNIAGQSEPTTIDPTDAPDLAGSALRHLSRFGLLALFAPISLALGVLVLSVLAPDRCSCCPECRS